MVDGKLRSEVLSLWRPLIKLVSPEWLGGPIAVVRVVGVFNWRLFIPLPPPMMRTLRQISFVSLNECAARFCDCLSAHHLCLDHISLADAVGEGAAGIPSQAPICSP